MGVIKLCMCLCALVFCRLESCATTVRGNSIAETRVFNISSCNEIRLTGSMNVHIVHGDAYRVEATLDTNLFDVFEAVSENGILRIGFQKNANVSCAAMCTVTVTTPVVSKIRISGAINADMTGFTKSINKLTVTISGASVFSANVFAKHIRADISGSSGFDLSGSAERCSINLSGASKMCAYQFDAARADITCKGASDAELCVKDTLFVCASGASSVKYRGNPAVTLHVSGAAVVKAG